MSELSLTCTSCEMPKPGEWVRIEMQRYDWLSCLLRKLGWNRTKTEYYVAIDTATPYAK